jgi:L-arabinokinase
VTLYAEAQERDAFIALARRVTAPGAALSGFFTPSAPLGVARAPGRLDVMGGIADYSGSLVLELPIAEAAFAAAQLHPEPGVRVVSLDWDRPERARTAHYSLSALVDGGYAGAQRLFRNSTEQQWAAYVAGVLLPLQLDLGTQIPPGVRILVSSAVPEGKGVSSSAALEVAAFFALAEALGVRVAPEVAAVLCQKVENSVVGAPCGVMDQIAVACGKRGGLLRILCQPACLLGAVPVSEKLAFFGIDSGVRHAVSGSDYRRVRVAAFMGYRLLAEAFGLAAEPADPEGIVRVEDRRFLGYLANMSPSELEADSLEKLPEWLSGAEFLARYGGISDSVTRVDPLERYPVRAATEHPIREHQRVQRFAELLAVEPCDSVRLQLGALMYESHQSYSACGLGSENTDHLVRLAREWGADAGIYGAKITGGGSGGTVAILGRADAEPQVRELSRRYTAESGHEGRLFVGSSAGAAQLGSFLSPPVSIAGSKPVT